MDGRPLLQHVIDVAATARLAPIVVVLGYRAADVVAALQLPDDARIVDNPAFPEGQSSSLRCGLAALGPDVAAAVILMGDQPRIRPEAIRDAVEAYRRTKGPVVRTLYRGRPGHPVVLDRSVWPALMAETEDRGARGVLAEHPDWIVPLDRDEDPPADIDTREDYDGLVGG